MRIGIIGAGNIGGTLARRLTTLGHQVAVANSRGPETLTALAEETGAVPVDVTEAVRDVEIVIVAIPEHSVADLPAGLFEDTSQSLAVVDTGNYYPRERDGRIEEIENGLTESGWVADQLRRPVIKAFNNIMATRLLEAGRPAGTPNRIALPIAGDDPTAKATVMQLVNQLGFDPIDAGSLVDSWRQQPGTPVYLADLDFFGAKAALAQAQPERQPAFRGSDRSPGSFADPR